MTRARWAGAAGGLIAAASLLALPGLAANSVPGIGINAAIRNVVQLKIITENAFRPAILREPIHIGDRVTSGPNSAMQVLLKDQTVFTVGANAQMTIDRFVYDPDRGTGSLAASVARGAFRFMSGRAAHTPGQVAIRTPVASIGVRGTIVEVMVGEEALALMQAIPALKDATFCGTANCDAHTASLIVLRGPGPKRTGNDRVGAIEISANGRTLLVDKAGVVVVPGPGQAPVGPFPLPPAIVQFLDLALSTAPATQTQRDHIASVERSVRAAVALADPNASLELARVALDEQSTPGELQAALAAAAADFRPGSHTFDLLMRMSFLVMQTRNAPSVDTLGHELATDRGLREMAGYSNAHDLATALSSFVVTRTAAADMPFHQANSWRLSDDSPAVVELIRELPQGSAFGPTRLP